MTSQQANEAVNLLTPKYPDAMVEPDNELQADDDDSSAAARDYSVAFGGTVADTVAEIVEQVKEDFGFDPEAENLIALLERL